MISSFWQLLCWLGVHRYEYNQYGTCPAVHDLRCPTCGKERTWGDDPWQDYNS